ncbi:MAG TPA: YidC/Oxa1 family membrane protein insertase [Patescibacteria group bacterium]|nr:YidC/Oxa1 family membrane protein insertase [Patescibacteria group bacterium]
MGNIFQLLLLSPFHFLLQLLLTWTGNLGLAIISLTLLIRFLLLPITVSSIKSQKKLQSLQPEMNKLKKKHKVAGELQKAQQELLKANNINPLSGCLPMVAQLIIFLALYRVLSTFVTGEIAQNSVQFLWLNLSKPDNTLVIPILAGVSQLVLSLMLLPGKEKHDLVPDNAKDKKTKDLNKKETQSQDMAESMQRQMVFMMPFITGWFAYRFPSGLGLYWVVTTVFSVVQQWVITGPGGLIDSAIWAKNFVLRTRKAV